MTITLYKSPGERNLLNRSLTIVKTMNTIEATDEINIESPTVLIDRDDSIIGFDYAYIPAFNRYYFLTGLNIVNGNQFRLELTVDPLMSFRNQILNSQCIAKRSTSNINQEIEDNQVVFKATPKRINRKMTIGFTPSSSGGCYILTLGGKQKWLLKIIASYRR